MTTWGRAKNTSHWSFSRKKDISTSCKHRRVLEYTVYNSSWGWTADLRSWQQKKPPAESYVYLGFPSAWDPQCQWPRSSGVVVFADKELLLKDGLQRPRLPKRKAALGGEDEPLGRRLLGGKQCAGCRHQWQGGRVHWAQVGAHLCPAVWFGFQCTLLQCCIGSGTNIYQCVLFGHFAHVSLLTMTKKGPFCQRKKLFFTGVETSVRSKWYVTALKAEGRSVLKT